MKEYFENNVDDVKIFKMFMYVCMDMWSWDAEISFDGFINQVRGYIENLRSHIGKEAHEHRASCGVDDNTGMSWEEQDNQALSEIRNYENLIAYLKNDSNWTV